MSVLIYDLPREKASEKVKINRELKKINAKMIQFSVWRSENTNELIDIASLIKRLGGQARILEERFIF